MRLFKKLARARPEINIFTNSYNPIKLLIIVAQMLKTFSLITYNLESVFEEVMKDIEMLVVKIIEEKASSDAIRNWLYTRYDKKRLVVDILADFEFLEILNHPIIVKTVDQIWMGKYDLVEGLVFKEDFMLPLEPIEHYSLNHGVYVDDVFSY